MTPRDGEQRGESERQPESEGYLADDQFADDADRQRQAEEGLRTVAGTG
jgi:hypothetical protein